MKNEVRVKLLDKTEDVIINRLIELAGKRQTNVFLTNLPISIHSLCYRNSRTNCILINNTNSINQIRYELAYSLGHITLHKGMKINCLNEAESESPLWQQMQSQADKFARKLLYMYKIVEKHEEKAS
jgi:Zn-dependent peptidase ImmA (M78 family)